MTLILRYWLMIYLRSPAQIAASMLFFLLVAIMMVFSLNPEPSLLQMLGPSVVIIAALFAMNVYASQLFDPFASGQLLILLQQGAKPHHLVIGIWLASLMVMLVPLLLLSPVIAGFYQLQWSDVPLLWSALVLGLPVMNAVNIFGAALTLQTGSQGAEQGGARAMVRLLLTSPLSVPVLIAASACGQGSADAPYLLIGFALFLIPLMLAAASVALKEALWA